MISFCNLLFGDLNTATSAGLTILQVDLFVVIDDVAPNDAAL